MVRMQETRRTERMLPEERLMLHETEMKWEKSDPRISVSDSDVSLVTDPAFSLPVSSTHHEKEERIRRPEERLSVRMTGKSRTTSPHPVRRKRQKDLEPRIT